MAVVWWDKLPISISWRGFLASREEAMLSPPHVAFCSDDIIKADHEEVSFTFWVAECPPEGW